MGHSIAHSRPILLPGEGELVYLCGNSLGLLPKRGRQIVNEELDVWSKRSVLADVDRWRSSLIRTTNALHWISMIRAVYGHFAHPHERPWKDIDQCVTPGLARLVGKSPLLFTSCLQAT